MSDYNSPSDRPQRDLMRLPHADVAELIGEMRVAAGQSATPRQLRRWEADWRAWCSFSARMGCSAVPMPTRYVRQFLLEAIIAGARKPRLGQYLKSLEYIHTVSEVKGEWPSKQLGRILEELIDRHLATSNELRPRNPVVIKPESEKTSALETPPIKTNTLTVDLKRLGAELARSSTRPPEQPISSKDAPWLSLADRVAYIRNLGLWSDGGKPTLLEWLGHQILSAKVISRAEDEFRRSATARKDLLKTGSRLIYGRRPRHREFAVDVICGAIFGTGGLRRFEYLSGGSIGFQELQMNLGAGMAPSDTRIQLARRCAKLLTMLYVSKRY